MITKKNIEASIIGYWRSGATLSEISKITGLKEIAIKIFINKYEAKSNDNR